MNTTDACLLKPGTRIKIGGGFTGANRGACGVVMASPRTSPSRPDVRVMICLDHKKTPDRYSIQFIELAETRTDHRYTTHPTYTGRYCALCGLPEGQHA